MKTKTITSKQWMGIYKNLKGQKELLKKMDHSVIQLLLHPDTTPEQLREAREELQRTYLWYQDMYNKSLPILQQNMPDRRFEIHIENLKLPFIVPMAQSKSLKL